MPLGELNGQNDATIVDTNSDSVAQPISTLLGACDQNHYSPVRAEKRVSTLEMEIVRYTIVMIWQYCIGGSPIVLNQLSW